MVEYIKYKQEKLPVRISYYCLKKVKEETGKDFDSFDDDLTVLEPVLFYGLIAGHKAEEKEMNIPREDIEFILDEIFTDFLEVINKFFPAAEEAVEVDTDKKK